jgi:uncharacterized membrane protein YeiB
MAPEPMAALPRATPTPLATGRRRLDGLDAARALAFAGMLLAHFAFSDRPSDPGWLSAIDAAADGRAAPLFCLLLGVGSGLLIARGTPDSTLVKRGVLLFALGLALWPVFDRVYLILPHYGALLMLMPLLRRLATRWLLPLAGLAFLVPSVVVALVDGHRLRGAPQPNSYTELTNLGGVVEILAWTGGYPLVGWVGFALVGVWVSRQRLADRAVQLRLLIGGALVAATQPLWAWIHDELAVPGEPADARGWAAFFDGSAHSNQTAWYVVASGTAVAVIGACLVVADLTPARWRLPIVRLGQLALTAYIAHLVLGEVAYWDWQDQAKPLLVTEVAIVAAVLVAFAAVATLWRVFFARGPLESGLRALSG